MQGCFRDSDTAPRPMGGAVPCGDSRPKWLVINRTESPRGARLTLGLLETAPGESAAAVWSRGVARSPEAQPVRPGGIVVFGFAESSFIVL